MAKKKKIVMGVLIALVVAGGGFTAYSTISGVKNSMASLGGKYSVIEPGENGFAYENEAEFDAALERMLSDPDWRARAGRRSEEISEAFDTPAFGRAAETVYAEVIAAAKRGEGEGK